MRTLKPPRGGLPNLAHPHLRGLVGAWLLNEGSGQRVHDHSGRNRRGTLTSMDFSSWARGPHGHALLFDGSADYIDFGASGWNGLLNASTGFTITAWFQAGSAPGSSRFRHLVAISQNFGTTSHYVGFGTTGTTNNFKLLSNGETPGSGTALTAGAWYFGAMTWDGTQFRPYLNGKLDYAAFTPSGSNWKTGATLVIARPGVLNGFHLWHDARVSDLRLFNRPLSAAEILTRYQRPYVAWDVASPAFAFAPISATAYEDTLTEALSLADTASDAVGAVDTLAEALALTDGVSDALGLIDALADALALADSTGDTISIADVVSDALALTDSAPDALALVDVLAEVLSLVDSVGDVLTGGTLLEDTLTESLALTDAVLVSTSITDVLTESLGLSDTSPDLVALIDTIAETLALSDSTLESMTMIEIVTDGLSLIDTVLDSLDDGSVVDVPGRHAVIVRSAAHTVIVYQSGAVVRIRQQPHKVTLQ